ncbi:MAG: 50S ribosomal protein L5 [Gemmatimonadaceae bacterium]|nr:50S ribosomal protein L5 [Gemmatimonadaceae bacterium]
MATKEKGGKGGKNATPAKGGKGGAPAGGKGGKTGGASKSSKGAENSRRNAEKAARGPHTGAALAPIAPRLKRYYTETVRDRLAKQFSLANVHEIPTLEKIVLNCGVGEAIKTPKVLDSVCEELELISGQKPIRRKAKKSIANYGLREGQEIGAQVTLRGARMWEFLDRFVTISIPRIRDFRGLGTRAFDGRGNYSLGVKEQMIFPEINYDMVEQVHGMDITFVTSSTKDDQALALLRELGMPFKGESPNIPPLT